ncbi:unnamed protein product [Rotaria socialis]|uniref:Uncharacterized protein n=1 Tax=Rotaria socialis TaxID=392032 RepID=A0A821QLG9_9BILA|nr:unnamed protein product [Rotaria socialis]CAF4824462.1 unnamed protein product [Rotaria socialis]
MRLQLWLLLVIGMAITVIAKGYNNDADDEHERVKRQAGSCIHPRFDWAKRVACIASCKVQNCATGYCRGTTCVCSRCSSGWQGK